MVNEPMPWQLTIDELRDFLAESDTNGVVGLLLTPDDMSWLRERPADFPGDIILNLTLMKRPGTPVLMFRLARHDPP